MKVIRKKLVNTIVGLAKKGAKDDINSTSSPWMYQPQLPKSADKFRKK